MASPDLPRGRCERMPYKLKSKKMAQAPAASVGVLRTKAAVAPSSSAAAATVAAFAFGVDRTAS